jgi:hypothetical protein
MRRKGITIWEQRVEWIVLGVAVAAFAVFTALQFVGEPNAVTINGKTVAPGDVDRLLAAEAERLSDRLSQDAPPGVEIDLDAKGSLDDFNELLVADVSPGGELPALQPRLALGTSEVAPGGVAFVEPQIEAPTPLGALQTFDALAEGVVEEYEALAERYPEDPRDLTWITPAAVLDAAAVLAEFRREPADEDIAAIPPAWFNDQLMILDVKIERQELVNDGWTNLTLLEPIPGQQTYRARLTGPVDAAARDEILDEMSDRAVREAIIQPEFYPTRKGNWLRPSLQQQQAAPDETEQEREIRRLRLQLSQKRRDRDHKAQQLKDAGGPLGDPGDRRDRGRPGGGGREGPRDAPGPGGMGQGEGGRRTGQDEKTQILRQNLTKQLERLERQIERLETQLAPLIGEEALVEEDGGPEGGLDSDQWLIWGHDITVEPGRTYRYRFTVEAYNPFFARKLNLVEEQHPLADTMTLSSQTSEWSKSIKVEPMLRFFIAKAVAQDQDGPGPLGLGQVRADVYRFHDARWWERRFTVGPGERIGQLENPARGGANATSIDYRTDWFVLDIVADLEAGNTDVRDQMAAAVVLQCLSTGEVAPPRDPKTDAEDEARKRLKEQVRDADDEAALAGEPSGEAGARGGRR